MKKVLEDTPDPIGGISDRANEIVLRALRKKKDERWSSVKEMLCEISELLGLTMSTSGKYSKEELLVEYLKMHIQAGSLDRAKEVLDELGKKSPKAKAIADELKEELEWRAQNEVPPDESLIMRVGSLKKVL